MHGFASHPLRTRYLDHNTCPSAALGRVPTWHLIASLFCPPGSPLSYLCLTAALPEPLGSSFMLDLASHPAPLTFWFCLCSLGAELLLRGSGLVWSPCCSVCPKALAGACCLRPFSLWTPAFSGMYSLVPTAESLTAPPIGHFQ